MKTLFVSHAEEDGQLARALINAMSQSGYDCWCYEDDFIPGLPYLLTTQRAIAECRAFMLLISNDSMDTREVDVEVECAHQKAKPIIPVLIGVTDLEYRVRKPIWSQVIATNASIPISMQTVVRVAERIAVGLRERGISPVTPPIAVAPEITAVLKKMGSRSTREKVGAALALLCQDLQAMTPGLISALRDPDIEVRRGAAYALRGVKDPSTLEPLLAALRDPANAGSEARLTIIGTLACHSDKRAATALVELLRDPDARARAKAAGLIGALGDPSLSEVLSACLGDPDADVRASAAHSLGEMGTENAQNFLKKAQDDPSAEVRAEAARGLQRAAAKLKAADVVAALESARRAAKEERWSEAMTLLNTAAAAAPSIDVIYLMRARVHLALGQIDDAAADAGKVWELARNESDRKHARKLDALIEQARSAKAAKDPMRGAG